MIVRRKNFGMGFAISDGIARLCCPTCGSPQIRPIAGWTQREGPAGELQRFIPGLPARLLTRPYRCDECWHQAAPHLPALLIAEFDGVTHLVWFVDGEPIAAGGQ